MYISPQFSDVLAITRAIYDLHIVIQSSNSNIWSAQIETSKRAHP